MKLLFRNQAYRILTLSRFFNAFGASIFNLVFIVYASTLPQASFAVAMANIVMILPTLFTVFAGIRADYTRARSNGWSIAVCFRRFYFF
ncbi:major facilitator superfamily permease [Streptococcus pneumoniae]|nr:major facilitator superfamily permease [Streptococcus pneumoniae]